MELNIRNYKPADLESIYEICLKTGKSGEDATELFKNPKLLGQFYAAPYAVYEPELCFILTVDGKPSGYILGTSSSENFAAWSEKEWFAVLRGKYKPEETYKTLFEKRIVEIIHEGYNPKPEFKNYPAHLHIDLLPAAQGKGMGRTLINTFIEKLRSMNVNGLHLEVGKKNTSAIIFYEKIGFELISEFSYSLGFGMKL